MSVHWWVHAFPVAMARTWNSLPNFVTSSSLLVFKWHLKTVLFLEATLCYQLCPHLRFCIFTASIIVIVSVFVFCRLFQQTVRRHYYISVIIIIIIHTHTPFLRAIFQVNLVSQLPHWFSVSVHCFPECPQGTGSNSTHWFLPFQGALKQKFLQARCRSTERDSIIYNI